jgi:hypothetical protein
VTAGNSRSAHEWVATSVTSAPLFSHVLSGETRTTGGRVSQVALCGEGHVHWEPVEEFAAPENLLRCLACLDAISDAMTRREWEEA